MGKQHGALGDINGKISEDRIRNEGGQGEVRFLFFLSFRKEKMCSFTCRSCLKLFKIPAWTTLLRRWNQLFLPTSWEEGGTCEKTKLLEAETLTRKH